ncbi:Uncharacterised protein [Vibrio cholerae]|nr:Uncharacterised protein [Vibrio cholerae]
MNDLNRLSAAWVNLPPHNAMLNLLFSSHRNR